MKGRTSDPGREVLAGVAGTNWSPPATAPPARILTEAFWHQGSTRLPVLYLADPARYDARYRRAGGTGTWYASSTPEGVWAELFRHTTQLSPADLSPRRMARVEARGLRLLDLTDATVRSQVGLSINDLTSDTREGLAHLAVVAEWAASNGFEAILAPSAARAHAQTLTVFPVGMTRLTVVTQTVQHAPQL